LKRLDRRKMVKALVVGSGGREHSIAYMLKKSSLIDRLYWTPANGGAQGLCENPGIPADDFEALLKFAKKEAVDITVVGPEAPLVGGIADLFREQGLSVYGPSKEGAMIEGSKVYAKALMERRAIPTARFKAFSDRSAAFNFIKRQQPPYVIKADGLAAGKGVIIVNVLEDADRVLHDMFVKRIFGNGGTTVVIEEYLEGEEATVLALVDGKNILPLVSSQDHKAVYDGDRGPNTGGMGAIAPAPVVTDIVMGKVMEHILVPLVEEFTSHGIDYRGVIYAGLMIRDEQPFVVEFNCRFGDPEAEAVLPLLGSDLCELILATVHGKLDGTRIRWKEGYCCDVVLASGGYPGKYEKGKRISGIGKADVREDVFVFHAGTTITDGSLVTNGGRVLNVAGRGATLKEAIDTAYDFIKYIRFEKMHYRRDIGHHALKYLS
jgi:phosphoribosylamine--glycine ligase